MEKISSFTVNHLELFPGVYVSRLDRVGEECITSFDLRMTAPNREPALDGAAMHAMEHLAATFLRNHPVWGSRVIYFGPMGCRTGFYLLLSGELSPRDIIPLLVECFGFIKDFHEEIPGASPRDCGNFLYMNPPMARWYAERYLKDVLLSIDESRLNYPE